MNAVVTTSLRILNYNIKLGTKIGIPLRFIYYPIFIAVIGFSQNFATADTLELKDGTTITGEIITTGDKEIVIRTIVGELTLDRQNIAKVYDIDQASPASNTTAETLSIHEKEQFADTILEANIYSIFKKYPEGVMVGPTLGRGAGLFASYDRTLSWKTQLHIQYDSMSTLRLDDVATSIDQNTFAYTSFSNHKLFATCRYFPSTTSGFYLGGGSGISSSNFTLDRINSFDYTDPVKPTSSTYNYAYHSNQHGAFIVGEFGFQNRGNSENNVFYTHIGLQLAKFIYTTDSFDINDVPASPYTNEIIKLHDKQENISQLVVGIGIYF